MWKHAEVVGLLDRKGYVRLVSRNEAEARVKQVIGRNIRDLVAPESRGAFDAAFRIALAGGVAQDLLAGVGDDGSIYWGRVEIRPSPEEDAPVLFHMRRLPRSWSRLTDRERAVIEALHASDMNSKRAANRLGISVHTLNSHRRSICRKCQLDGVGEFWIFVEHCR